MKGAAARCAVCGGAVVYEFTDEEWAALARASTAAEVHAALVGRPEDFRGSVITHTHPGCWAAHFLGLAVGG